MDEETRPEPTQKKRGGRPLGPIYPHRQHVNMGSLDLAFAEELARRQRSTPAGVIRRGVMEQAKAAGLTPADVAERVAELDAEAERVMEERRKKYPNKKKALEGENGSDN